VLIFDTAGRLTIDEAMMAEAKAVKGALKPHQVVLVVDGMTGQDAVKTGEAFHRELGVDGVVLTKMDGDARGGAALSLRHVTGRPIVFLSTGEKVDALEPFHPDRLASRLLGMGDVLTLVEKAQEKVDLDRAMDLENKLRKSDLTLEDFLAQMREMKKLGSLAEILKLLPGGHRVDHTMSEAGEKELKRVEAIILAMTPHERRKPQVLGRVPQAPHRGGKRHAGAERQQTAARLRSSPHPCEADEGPEEEAALRSARNARHGGVPLRRLAAATLSLRAVSRPRFPWRASPSWPSSSVSGAWAPRRTPSSASWSPSRSRP